MRLACRQDRDAAGQAIDLNGEGAVRRRVVPQLADAIVAQQKASPGGGDPTAQVWAAPAARATALTGGRDGGTGTKLHGATAMRSRCVGRRDYQPPFPFSGKLQKVTLSIDRPVLTPEG